MGEKHLPETIERLRRRFDEWRGLKGRRDRIPERLWAAAVEAARRHGVYAVCRAVNLEYASLSRRLRATSCEERHVPAFIELEASVSAAIGCIVELERSNGTRIRICVRDGASVDWAWLKEAFLGA